MMPDGTAEHLLNKPVNCFAGSDYDGLCTGSMQTLDSYWVHCSLIYQPDRQISSYMNDVLLFRLSADCLKSDVGISRATVAGRQGLSDVSAK